MTAASSRSRCKAASRARVAAYAKLVETTIPPTSGFDVLAQVVDLCRVRPDDLDPRLAELAPVLDNARWLVGRHQATREVAQSPLPQPPFDLDRIGVVVSGTIQLDPAR